MAAALVLVLLPRKPDPATATVRLKGSAHIGFFVQRGERSQRAAPLYVVHPGDRIRFEYSSEEPAYLAILALDGAQTASVYFPEGPTAEQVPAGTDMLLRSAVELDAVLGDETVYALFCDAPFALAPLRAQLAAAKLLSPAPHCRMDTLTWRKESDR